MLAYATKNKVEVAQGETSRPIYGGLNDYSVTDTFPVDSFDLKIIQRHIHDRAVQQMNALGKDNARALIEIGDIHYQNASYDRASKAYIKALKSDEENIPTYQKLIRALVANRKIQQADQFFKILLSKVANHPRYLADYITFQIMMCIIDESFVPKSQDIINENKDSKNDLILNAIGLFENVISRDTKEAKKFYIKALMVNENNVHANNNLGICYRDENEYRKAEKHLQKAHFLDLHYQSAYENLASLYFVQNRLSKAVKILESAEENQVELSMNWKHNLAMFYFMLSDFKASIKSNLILYELETNNNLILNNIGASYEKLGKLNKAKKYYDDAVSIVKSKSKNIQVSQLDPRDATAFLNLTRLYVNEGDTEKAMMIIKLTHKLFPNNPIAYHQESVIAIRNKDYSLAKQKLEKALLLNPQYLDAAVDLSYILEEIELDYDKAIEILEPLKHNSPEENNSQTRDNNLAFAYLKVGQVEKARPLLHEDDKTFASYATKGYYYLLQDDLKKSNEMYELAKETAPNPLVSRQIMQSYHFENMEYWDSRGDTKKALSHAKQCLKFIINLRVEALVEKYIKSRGDEKSLSY